MKFRLTIEYYDTDRYSGDRYWKPFHSEEITIPAAEMVARQITRIVESEGLSVDESKIRQVLYDELGEK